MPFKIRDAALASALALSLGSCGMVDGQRDNRIPAAKRPGGGSQQAVSDFPVKIGPPYTVGGVTFVPADVPNYDEVGYASWYGEELLGNDTANGERFEPAGISAAHPTLPLPSYVEVTSLETGRTILVRVNDRGPFSGNRILDLSRGAAEQLGITSTTGVRVRRVNPSEQEKAALRSGRPAAERIETPKQVLSVLSKRLASRPPAPVAATTAPATRPAKPAPASVPQGENQGGYVVQVAAFGSRERAEALSSRIGASLVPAGNLWRVRYGPYATREAAKAGVELAASKGFRDAAIVANDRP